MVDEQFWRGVIDEMFADGKYTSSRLKVVDLYTKSMCAYMDRIGREEVATHVKTAQEQWLEGIKAKV